ncbi:hypothetical protein [Colwellia psychrerythraea]|uniref:Putative lipoprotein n=1 Tax=Colwellia psychrerythraea (strain 34H / ATCC BAA-681) TaxID=167879 RepID=Q481P7_COLP3|nr:hypothetical protein [Colwellia psychrerythraea]AAZ25214.1 putative lipoprotein [Colwellia psychrerythraea 34H]
MSFLKSFFIFLVLWLSGCSSNPNYYEPKNCGSATPVCLAIAGVANMATHDSGPSKKCSDMTGERREQCMAKVDSLKKHIKDASENR